MKNVTVIKWPSSFVAVRISAQNQIHRTAEKIFKGSSKKKKNEKEEEKFSERLSAKKCASLLIAYLSLVLLYCFFILLSCLLLLISLALLLLLLLYSLLVLCVLLLPLPLLLQTWGRGRRGVCTPNRNVNHNNHPINRTRIPRNAKNRNAIPNEDNAILKKQNDVISM